MDRKKKKKKGRKESVPMEVMLMNGRGNEGKRTEKTAEKTGEWPLPICR